MTSLFYNFKNKVFSLMIIISIISSSLVFLFSPLTGSNPNFNYLQSSSPMLIKNNTFGDEVKGNMIIGNNTGFYIDSNGQIITSTNLTIYNISAGNISYVIEDNPQYSSNPINSTIYAMQFTITNDSYLGYLYVAFKRSLEIAEISVWNSTWNGTDIIPDVIIGNMSRNISRNVAATLTWLKFMFNKTMILRTAETYNSTFFITFNGTKYKYFDSAEWAYQSDSNSVDSGLAYLKSGNIWLLRDWDLSLNLTVYPLSQNPSPEGVNLKFGSFYNNEWHYQKVINKIVNGTNAGMWVNNTVLRPIGNRVFYNASTSWSNIVYYVNYTIYTVPNGVHTVYYSNGGEIPVKVSFRENVTTTGNQTKIVIHSNENITNTEMILYNFTAYSYQKVIENYFGLYSQYNSINGNNYLMPFIIENSCLLEAIDILFFAAQDTTGNYFYLYNATWNKSRKLPIPDQKIYSEYHPEGIKSPGLIQGDIGWLSKSTLWNGTLNNSQLLDSSKTDNNTYFVGINSSVDMSWLGVSHQYDPTGIFGPAFLYYPSLSYWHNISSDLDLIVKLDPLNNTPNINELNLKINNQSVSTINQYEASWQNSTYLIPDKNGNVKFNVSSNWPNLTYIVNASMSRENLTSAKTNFWTEANNNTVLWNVSFSPTFPANSIGKIINFTLPTYWNVTGVFNNSVLFTNWHNSSNSNHQFLWVNDPSEGTWLIEALGKNMLKEIKLYKNNIPVEIITTFDIINVHSTFNTPTEGYGSGFIEVYDINQKLNYTNNGNGYNSGINITWNVRLNATTNGYYFVCLKWHNNYEAGAINLTVLMYNATSLIITRPDLIGNKIEMSPGTVFNLTLYYNMSYWDNGWTTYYFNGTEASVVYKTSWNNTWKPLTSVLHSKWEFTTMISSPSIEGVYHIYINATARKNVEEKHDVITLKIVLDSRLFFNDSAVTITRGEKVAINITYAYYNMSLSKYMKIQGYDLTATYTLGADSGDLILNTNYSYDNSILILDSNNFTKNGDYTINLLFESNKFKSQQFIIYFTILNFTTRLTMVDYQDQIVYNRSDHLNVILQYVNQENSSGINNATIWTNWSMSYEYATNNNSGYYNITLNITNLKLGYYTIKFTASAEYYDKASVILTFQIYGYPANYSITSEINGTFGNWSANIYSGDLFEINITYYNISNDIIIENANVTAKLDSNINCNVTFRTDGNYSILINSSKLSIPRNGVHILQIHLENESYEKLNINITITILRIPSELVLNTPEITGYIDDTIIFSVYFNDTHNNLGVDGTIYFDFNGSRQVMAKNGTTGYYQGIINLEGQVPANITIPIYGTAVDYVNATNNLIIHILKIPIEVIPIAQNLTGIVGGAINTSIEIKDINNRTVPNLTISWHLLSKNGLLEYVSGGIYKLNINLKGIGIGSYNISIEMTSTSKYQGFDLNLSLVVNKFTVQIISNSNLTSHLGDLVEITCQVWDVINGYTLSSVNMSYQVDNGTKYPMTSIGNGYYYASFEASLYGIGDHSIILNCTETVNYTSASYHITLHIRNKTSTKIAIINPNTISENSTLSIYANLSQSNNNRPLSDYFLSFSFTINFLNGSLKTKTINCLTNETGWASASLLIPIGSDSIVVIVSFEGTYNYSSTSDQILVKVNRIVYSLEIVVPPNAKINDVLTIKVILNTTYGKISNQTIFLTISILSSSGQLSNKILNATTDVNGTAYFYYLIPKDSAALTLMAEFQGSNGEYSKSNVNTVITVADWLLMIQRNLPIIILIFAIALIAIVVLLLYFKVFKPQVISLGDKRQKLILKRAETRKEIQRITDELTKERSNTISAAKEALLNDDFKTAEKLYEKAANLSLELSDKSLAKEFFSKAEEIRHKLNESKKRNTLFEQRTKFLNKARIAIQNRNVKEASEFYKKTAEISKLLGDMEAYNKYMKLAENASERIETLKAGDLRRKTGEFLNKADKLMAKQNYISAAHNFEAASRLLLKLGEEDGAEKFITWARLARERDIQEGQPSDQWITIIQNEIKNLKEKIKSALESANLKKAIEFYELMAILYTEINKPESAEKARNNAKKIEEKIEEKRVPQEINKLEELREIAFQKAQKYEAENKLAQASKYYKEAARLSEDLGEKEIAFGYLEKAKYLIKQIKKLQETKEKVKGKAEEEKLVPKEITKAEVELAKLNISDYLKNARNALKDELYAVALYFYEKIRDAYLILRDSTKATKTESKIKEIKAKMQLEKVSSEQLRSILPRLSSKAENLFKKQKYSEASILYYRIADIFFRLDDTDAGVHYLSRAEIAHKKSEK